MLDPDVKRRAEEFLFCSPDDTQTLSRVITQDELLNVSHLIVKVSWKFKAFLSQFTVHSLNSCLCLFRHTPRPHRSSDAEATATTRDTETCQSTVATRRSTRHTNPSTSPRSTCRVALLRAALPLRTADFRLSIE